jgi:hypothetical protein
LPITVTDRQRPPPCRANHRLAAFLVLLQHTDQRANGLPDLLDIRIVAAALTELQLVLQRAEALPHRARSTSGDQPRRS